MPEREKVIKGLEALRHAMSEHQCYVCSHEFIDAADEFGTNIIDDALALLKEQKAKTGHWIEKEDYNLDTYYDCSVCGESWTMIDGTPWENGMNYCPHCGARMITGGEAECLG